MPHSVFRRSLVTPTIFSRRYGSERRKDETEEVDFLHYCKISACCRRNSLHSIASPRSLEHSRLVNKAFDESPHKTEQKPEEASLLGGRGHTLQSESKGFPRTDGRFSALRQLAVETTSLHFKQDGEATLCCGWQYLLSVTRRQPCASTSGKTFCEIRPIIQPCLCLTKSR